MRMVVIALVLFAVAGCAGRTDAPRTVIVRGTVSVDGQPVPLGNIDYEPSDGTGRTFSGVIEEGKFEFHSSIGQKKVLIFASRKSGKKGEEFGNDLMESYIPEKYNSKSTLTATVTEQGENQFAFELSAMK